MATMLRSSSTGSNSTFAGRSGAGAAQPLVAARPRRSARSVAPQRLPAAAATDSPRTATGASASTSGPSMVPASTNASYLRTVRNDVSLFDALKFNGPAPEIINGRLAMLGMVWVAQGEAETGQTALQLLQHGAPWQYAAAALWVYASMVPVLKGARHEAFGSFTPRAEFTNGRAAMIGWAALLWLESKAGVPFF